MKKLFLFIFALAFILSFDVRVFADEGHSHTPNLKQATENMKRETSVDDHATMNHDSRTDMEGMDKEGSGDEDQYHHGPLVESPPNYKVLGSYGAVNLLFVLIGVWNRWFRRKGDVNNGNA
ncbi:hypothetical protein M3610_02690 [Neobacillus sp. MER 74]|uniref:hypothetical protein n=1 Tax=Neobacillus sp. MER 74 TaxID=2939566 RepID=UPI002040A16A|nr:hypothetical protein [Neobacillus sp. MER 74]MCM3114199.1 hypothetical protein [Neobacillus sp. MER 74]